jgi:hypothetical protein
MITASPLKMPTLNTSDFCSNRVKRIIIVGVVPVLLIAGIAMYFSGELELRVTPVNSDGPLLVLPLMPGEPFTVHYYHSVEDAPIWEVHALDATGRIFIEEERYLKFGAGMGKMPGVGHMVKSGPFEAIVGMHMPTGDFVLRIGSPGVNHTILWRGTRTNLSAIAPHRAVQFSGRPVSWGYALCRRFFPHRATPK